MSRRPVKMDSLELLRRRGVSVRTVLDVGVLNATPELLKVWPDVKHVLFEPVEEFGDQIRSNYADIDFELVLAAVGDRSGAVSLETFSVFEGQEISHSRMTSAEGQTNTRQVRLVSLDDWISANPQPDPFLVKIDVDGAEMKVLAGAREVLKRASVVIVEAPKSQLVERIDFVQKAGFTLFDLAEPCYYDGAFWQCDAIFVRDDIFRSLFRQLDNTAFEPGLYEMYACEESGTAPVDTPAERRGLLGWLGFN